MAKFDISVGCDPELFVFSKKENKIVSAYGLIPGTKHEPFKVKNGAIQVDGMAVEFNIDPAFTADDFRHNIYSVIQQLKEHLGPGYNLVFQPVADFDPEYLESQPAEARALGCDPDYNAYTGEPNPRPDAQLPIRTAAGHIHIGWTKDMNPTDKGHFEACCMLAKQMDILIGAVYRGLDGKEQRRNQLYGNFGAFRPKPYGMEYRVPSNRWLESERMILETWRLAYYAFNSLLQKARLYEQYDINAYQPWQYANLVNDVVSNYVAWDTYAFLREKITEAFPIPNFPLKVEAPEFNVDWHGERVMLDNFDVGAAVMAGRLRPR